jgi:hypothetical protein
MEERHPRQEYQVKPTTAEQVSGLSSRTIFYCMTLGSDHTKWPIDSWRQTPYPPYHPIDVNDWERNRALLLMYPEWRQRLDKLKVLSLEWEQLVMIWHLIEDFYNADIAASKK